MADVIEVVPAADVTESSVGGAADATETVVHSTPTVNVPLTDAQKLLLRSYQNKLNLLAKQKSDIDVQVARVEGAMQLDMMKIARENNIDPTKFGFNDNLEIIPSQPLQGMPRRA